VASTTIFPPEPGVSAVVTGAAAAIKQTAMRPPKIRSERIVFI